MAPFHSPNYLSASPIYPHLLPTLMMADPYANSCWFFKESWICLLKDKSGIVIIVNYSRDYTVVNGVQYFFQFFSLLICETTYFNLISSVQ